MRDRHIIKQATERPWAVTPEKLEAITEVLEFHSEGVKLSQDEIVEHLNAADTYESEQAIERPHAAAGQSKTSTIGVLPVRGTIFPRANALSSFSGGTTAEGLLKQFRTFMDNPRVDAIVFDIDSPGGQVGGIPELADEIASRRGEKPMIAVANSFMASGAYWIGAAAGEVWATPASMTGSIGVYSMHRDISKLREKAGIALTFVSAGKYKTEGFNGPLTDEARASIQADVDELYTLFVESVADSRGVTSDDVRNGFGEGRVLSAQRALADGLIDRIGTLEEAVAHVAELARDGAAQASAERAAVATAQHVAAELEDEGSTETPDPDPDMNALDDLDIRERRLRLLRT